MIGITKLQALHVATEIVEVVQSENAGIWERVAIKPCGGKSTDASESRFPSKVCNEAGSAMPGKPGAQCAWAW